MLWVGESLPWELRWHRANSLIIFQDPANFPGTRHWIDNTYETGGGNFITGYNSCAYVLDLGGLQRSMCIGRHIQRTSLESVGSGQAGEEDRFTDLPIDTEHSEWPQAFPSRSLLWLWTACVIQAANASSDICIYSPR
jgi:hypothetical protein